MFMVCLLTLTVGTGEYDGEIVKDFGKYTAVFTCTFHSAVTLLIIKTLSFSGLQNFVPCHGILIMHWHSTVLQK